ncbi:MAG: serine/threonine protein kinase, partial [Xanthomonadales bacterium]|nr:serine/threonine protein kinase [Xanthomonadales bacterium]
MGAISIPGYEIERELGVGGMARVYLAIQSSLERRVALKVMAPALAADASFSKRFLREARTIASLTHPHIVAVYEVGVTNDHLHYFSMQFLPGGDFAQRMRKGVDQAEVVRVLCGIAKALGFAHQQGVVHRDVTPGNIMFDGADTPLLTDFGIARALSGSTRITSTGVSIGTSNYMSPEQARGGEVDARSDLYSLGVLAFEALSGRPPYQGPDGFAVAYAHVFEPIPRLPPALQHWQAFI